MGCEVPPRQSGGSRARTSADDHDEVTPSSSRIILSYTAAASPILARMPQREPFHSTCCRAAVLTRQSTPSATM
eukprot:scaffold63289_cov28-Tisochrysis_lutea.AAC.5